MPTTRSCASDQPDVNGLRLQSLRGSLRELRERRCLPRLNHVEAIVIGNVSIQADFPIPARHRLVKANTKPTEQQQAARALDPVLCSSSPPSLKALPGTGS